MLGRKLSVGFQNKEKPGWTGKSSFVLEFAPQQNLVRTMWPDREKGLFIATFKTKTVKYATLTEAFLKHKNIL